VLPLKDNIPTERTAIVTIALIVANVLIYFIWQKGGILHGPGDKVVVNWAAIPYEFTHWGKHCGVRVLLEPLHQIARAPGPVCEGQVVHTSLGAETVKHVVGSQPPTIATAFSAMFMHGSIVHLGGNMLFLWIFGNNVEDSMGRVRFIVFYLLGGLAALAGQILVGPNAAVPTLGASGAIAAVLGGYLLLFPRARVITVIFIIFFFTIVELPAILILGFWFLQQILFGATDLTNPTGGGGGVAYFAHIGGFVFGLLLIRAFAQREKQVPPRFPVY
jgi:membrane associated rhomboid family serine protease